MTHADRYDAHAELGGTVPESLSLGSELALYHAGLGSKQMRRKVERYLDDQEKIRQDAINKAGAKLVREAGVTKPEEPQGIDTQPILDDWEEYAKKHQETSQ